ncbi:hypothetical protein OG2516_14451 [Oceanicola granulosus HTCC2516]|uniref:Uncharacterized protein n=1 Tax=Oceanicola granulosus (strain ATCC BAA-861 / DSM 15982 / KCTC 12143 / HTCC2516) TaxID=314256 RepID=Q2CEY7_OCEGH|nr:efflux RND transporter periplasmic adaptor subunit [Oceanicola granulosus]EAR51223.1 hypothetical protein OG2516_14451 [Oceanicola granulosus HTCC2516]
MSSAHLLAPGLAVALAGSALAEEVAPVTCLIEPAETAELSFAVEGLVSAVHVARGDVVAAGDVLAELEASVEAVQLELAQARAEDTHRVEAARARFAYLDDQAERAERLARNRSVPESQAREARMEAEVARQDLATAMTDRDLAAIEARSAAARLAQKRLRAPMPGIVTERALAVGELHQAQRPVLTLARIDRLKVEAFPPIDYIGAVAPGDVLTVRPEAPVGGEYAATVSVVDRVFDAATGTFGLELTLDNADLALPAGLRCELVFAPPA